MGNSLELDTDVDDAGGLEGQIILNARNLATNTDRWTAVTRVRDTSNQYVTLQVANSASNQYPDESSKLGGGAIGVVPFELHDQDCVPAHASLVCSVPTLEANEDRETVVLRHYGPIFDSKPSDEYKPLKIERRSNVCEYPCSPPPAWVDVSDDFVVVVRPGGATRVVWVYPEDVGGNPGTFGYQYEYRITMRDESTPTYRTDLRSDETFVASASDAPNVLGYPYTFNLLCMDMNMSNWIESGDVGAWVETPADLNSDGEADLTDLVLLVETVGGA